MVGGRILKYTFACKFDYRVPSGSIPVEEGKGARLGEGTFGSYVDSTKASADPMGIS